MKYVKVDWTKVEKNLNRKDFSGNVFYDSNKNCWFIPDFWEEDELLAEKEEELWCDIGDLDDAMG